MYLPLAGFPVRHLGSNNPVPKKVQSGVRSRQWVEAVNKAIVAVINVVEAVNAAAVSEAALIYVAAVAVVNVAAVAVIKVAELTDYLP